MQRARCGPSVALPSDVTMWFKGILKCFLASVGWGVSCLIALSCCDSFWDPNGVPTLATHRLLRANGIVADASAGEVALESGTPEALEDEGYLEASWPVWADPAPADLGHLPTPTPKPAAVVGRRTVEPNATELASWWRQPLLRSEVWENHVEMAFFPLNASDFSNITGRVFQAQYSRAWRRDSLLDLLTVWHRLCQRLGVQYWLDSGALLGRMRSGGESLIPWDVDVDVGMLRTDFAKLNHTISEAGPEGWLQGPSLGLPLEVLLTSRQAVAPAGGRHASQRNKIIPARMIDMRTGFYIDVFGDFFERADGNFQMVWPFGGPHECDDFPVSDEGGMDELGYDATDDWEQAPIQNLSKLPDDTCEPPCEGSTWCYIFSRDALLPVTRCSLKGVNESMYCPHDEKEYVRSQYYHGLEPDHWWNPEARDFSQETQAQADERRNAVGGTGTELSVGESVTAIADIKVDSQLAVRKGVTGIVQGMPPELAESASSQEDRVVVRFDAHEAGHSGLLAVAPTQVRPEVMEHEI